MVVSFIHRGNEVKRLTDEGSKEETVARNVPRFVTRSTSMAPDPKESIIFRELKLLIVGVLTLRK